MALVLSDRVRETTTTTGTGFVTLGGAYTGFQTFSAAIGNANNTYYTIANIATGEWEVGIGTYTLSTNTLSRDTVLSSSNAGSLVVFTAGTKDVFVTQPAERAVYVNAANTQVSVPELAATSITNSGNLTFTGTGNRITGDFSNATIANRLCLQNSVVNGASIVQAIPNGTGTTSGFSAFNNSDPTNAANIVTFASSTEARVSSGITGTGTYLPMTFFTGGSERVRVDTSGNVGIGTSSPATKLHVANTGSSAVQSIRLENSEGYAQISTDSNLATYDAQLHLFNNRARSTEYMRIDSSGNVGIGTSSPTNKLSVNGNVPAACTGSFVSASSGSIAAGFSDNINSSLYIRPAAGGIVLGTDSGGTIRFATNGNTTAEERMRIDSSGNLGIGTSSPSDKLTVISAGTQVGSTNFRNIARIGLATNDASVLLGYDVSAGSAILASTNNYPIAFWTSIAGTYAEKMRIDSSGNVGIGTASPSFASGGGLAIYNSSVPRLKFTNSTTGDASTDGTQLLVSGSDFYIQQREAASVFISTNGTNAVTVDASQNVGIGTSSPTGKLNVVTDNTHNGGATFDSTGTTQIWMRDTNSTANTKNWGFQISGGDFNILRANDDRATGFVTPVSFAQAPANSLIIDVSGNVGIGTSSPAFKLEVVGGTNNGIHIKDAASATVFGGLFTQASAFALIARSNHALTLGTNDTERMRIDSSGNVGIGTTSPASVTGYKLIEVQGSTGGIFQASASGNSVKARFYSTNLQGYTGTTSNHPFAFLTNDIERVTIDSSGNVGIGTSSPTALLHVSSTTANPQIKITDLSIAGGRGGSIQGSYGGNGLYLDSLAAAGWVYIGSSTGGGQATNIRFDTSNTERMRINSSGIMLMGATSARTSQAKIELTSPTNTALSFYMFKDAQVEMAMGFKSSTDTNFYIGTGSTSVGTNGVYLANTGTSWISNSDERLKENLVPIADAISKVSTLRSVIGNFIADKSKTPRPFLIAQDVQQVLPEAIGKSEIDGTEYLGVSYTDVIPLLVAAIKEQQTLITALTARITAFESI
jgi:hypothetical protein